MNGSFGKPNGPDGLAGEPTANLTQKPAYTTTAPDTTTRAPAESSTKTRLALPAERTTIYTFRLRAETLGPIYFLGTILRPKTPVLSPKSVG